MSYTEILPDVFLTSVATPEYDVRGALVLGTRRALVWDTLTHPRDMAPWLSLVGGRELVVAYSHADWDHVWGTGGLPPAAAIVAHATAAERFVTDVPATLAARRHATPGAWDEVTLVPPTQFFTQEVLLDLGGLTAALHHLPGHTADCCVGFVVERGVLLAGDTVETPCPVVPPGAPLDAWAGALRRWACDARVSLVVPAHGPIGGVQLAARTAAYLEALRDGEPLDPEEPLTAFYRETHARNLANTGNPTV